MNAERLMRLAHSPIYNYIVPGLTSWLLGTSSKGGCVRMFEMTRHQIIPITPHSHRFDFECQVLRGNVRNRVWTTDTNGDEYQKTTLVYGGEVGKYTYVPGPVERWDYRDFKYTKGDWYGMKSTEVHSIYFMRGSLVLFLEGPTVSDRSMIIEPVVMGETIPTLKTEPWMFRREPPNLRGTA